MVEFVQGKVLFLFYSSKVDRHEKELLENAILKSVLTKINRSKTLQNARKLRFPYSKINKFGRISKALAKYNQLRQEIN